MGYGIMPYMVNVNVLRSPHTYTIDPKGFLASLQDRHCGDDEFGPTRQSMREMFFGEPFTGTEGVTYGYTLKALCGTFGGLLDNGHWYPARSGWFDTVGAALAEVGVDFDPNDLIYSGAPVDLPPIVDFPVIGHLMRDEALRIAAALDAADLAAIGDQRVSAAITELHGWLRQCHDDKFEETDSYDLVCFYH